MSNIVSFSDDKNPKKDVGVFPLSAALATFQGRPQEEPMMAKPSPILPKKNLTAHL
jgi:hypothetical protein